MEITHKFEALLGEPICCSVRFKILEIKGNKVGVSAEIISSDGELIQTFINEYHQSNYWEIEEGDDFTIDNMYCKFVITNTDIQQEK